MTTDEVYEASKNNKQVYTIKRFFNGDYIPVKGYIRELTISNDYCKFNIITEELTCIRDLQPCDVYKEEDLSIVKEKINNLMLEHLPVQIQELESKLAERKRKLNKLLKEKVNEQ